MPDFQVVADIRPTGDQPEAIEELVAGLNEGKRFQTLLGVTGSGKTFTMANVVEHVNRPTHRAGTQQDAGRPALCRVQGVFPA